MEGNKVVIQVRARVRSSVPKVTVKPPSAAASSTKSPRTSSSTSTGAGRSSYARRTASYSAPPPPPPPRPSPPPSSAPHSDWIPYPHFGPPKSVWLDGKPELIAWAGILALCILATLLWCMSLYGISVQEALHFMGRVVMVLLIFAWVAAFVTALALWIAKNSN